MTLVTHLWQSTFCLGLAALAALALRNASARARHGVWLAASIKFLVPFSALAAAGRIAGASISTLSIPHMGTAWQWVDRSLPGWSIQIVSGEIAATAVSQTALVWLTLAWAAGVVVLLSWRLMQWRSIEKVARLARPLEHGREADALQRIARMPAGGRLMLRQSESQLEPGVVGLFRPWLLWPAGLSPRLTDRQLESIMAHEACHASRRDNVSAAIHMAVEILFWFHPLVWWLGSRLVTERERACDEEVVRMGTDKRHYAEGLLEVCRFCLRSPLPLVAGVGGSNLAARVERIMTAPLPKALSRSKQAILACALGLIATAPIAAGALTAISASQGQVYRVGADGVKAPKLIKETKPVYTRAAMDAKIQGMVRMEAIVLEDGTVGEVVVTESLDREYGLDDEAVKALRQWVFAPGTKDDKPVAVRVEIEMKFTLK
jgi:TonB family protein